MLDNVNTQIFCKVIYTCGILLSSFHKQEVKHKQQAIAPPNLIAQRYQHFLCVGWGGGGVLFMLYPAELLENYTQRTCRSY